MFKVIGTKVREYQSAREVAKDLYFREKKAGKTKLPFNEGIKFYMGFIGENIHLGAFDMICGGKTITIKYE